MYIYLRENKNLHIIVSNTNDNILKNVDLISKTRILERLSAKSICDSLNKLLILGYNNRGTTNRYSHVLKGKLLFLKIQ